MNTAKQLIDELTKAPHHIKFEYFDRGDGYKWRIQLLKIKWGEVVWDTVAQSTNRGHTEESCLKEINKIIELIRAYGSSEDILVERVYE